jgi:phosphatidate cytidylyltransferase
MADDERRGVPPDEDTSTEHPAAKPADPAAKPADPAAKPAEAAAKSADPAAKPADPSESVRIIGGGDEPPLRFGPDDTGPLPHWTAPPTGEVPRIFGDEASSDDFEAWSSLARGPVWRDDKAGYDDETIDFAPLGEGTRVGALDEHGSGADPFFGDEDTGTPEPARVTPIRTRRSLGATAAGRHVDDAGYGGGNPEDLPVRVAVGAGLAVIAIVLFILGPAATMVLVVAVVGLCAVEFYDKLRERGYQPATLVGLAAVVGMPLAAYWKGEAALPLVMALAVGATLVWFLLSGGLESGPLPNTAVTLLGVVYIGMLGSYAALILKFPNGIGTITVLALGTIATDAGAYFVGRAAGNTPLLDWVSPTKTVEGLGGGMLATLLVLVLVKIFGSPFPWAGDGTSWAHLIALAAVIAVAAPLGDLAESMLKRNLDIKDFGTILPGHGGVLDRFDAFLFVLPAVYYLSIVLEVG